VEYVAEQHLSGLITPGASEALLEGVTRKVADGATRIVLTISSPGGQVKSAIRAFEELKSLPAELVTHGSGEVASMGAALYLAGEWRTAHADTTFLVHRNELVLGGKCFTTADLEARRVMAERLQRSTEMRQLDEWIRGLAQDDQFMRSLLVERTSVSESQAAALMEAAKPITAARAKDLGIVHEIIGQA
jgi:ATP-dependent protease ClpP protease subunit